MRYFPAVFLFGFLSSVFMAPALAQQVEPPDEAEQTEPIQPPVDGGSVVETNETLDRLFEKLRKDPKQSSAGATARMIWREWSYSGSRSVDLLMKWAARAMGTKDFSKAQDLLDHVIVIAPDYAEGWNRRATLYYTIDDFGKSLADIETTLALEPRHFGALSGLAAIMQRIGREEEALEAWYKVLEIYPANKQAQEAVIQLEEALAGRRT